MNERILSVTRQREEPWVSLPTGKELATWSKESLIEYNQMNRQEEKAALYVRAFDFLSNHGVTGDYYEFGCHRCRTFRMALSEAARQMIDDMDFYAFDSFEGLPEPETEHGVNEWKGQSLATSEDVFMGTVENHGLFTDRVRTVKGFYDISLTPDLQAELLTKGSKAALVTVDCDLYESAVPVFAFIESFLQEGTIIYIDDLFAGYKGNPYSGVGKAFLEFQKTSEWTFVRHLNVGWWGRSYITCAKGTTEGVI